MHWFASNERDIGCVGVAKFGLGCAKLSIGRLSSRGEGLVLGLCDDSAQRRLPVRDNSGTTSGTTAYYKVKPILDKLAASNSKQLVALVKWAQKTKKVKRLDDWAQDKTPHEMPGQIAEMIAREQIAASLGPNQSVTRSASLVVEEIPGYRTVEQFIEAEVAAGRPAPKRFTMREGEGKVWRVIAEIDNMVFEEGPAGKRIVTVDEVKAGENSKPKEAVDSLKKIKNALRLVASGTAKLFSEQSPFELGTETGATLEWSQLGNIKYETRGAANKTGWDHNLPYDAATLKKAVLSFWDSLPPNVQNQMMPPSTHPDADKDENEPE